MDMELTAIKLRAMAAWTMDMVDEALGDGNEEAARALGRVRDELMDTLAWCEGRSVPVMGRAEPD